MANEQPLELSPQEVAKLLAEGAPPLLLDLRDAAERRQGYLADSLHLPLEELAERVDLLPRNQTVICYCAVGNRSAFAAEALRAAGFSAYSLRGGVEEWVKAELPLVKAGAARD